LGALWPGPRPPGARLLLGCLAVGCGLGISSCALFAWQVAVGPPGVGFTLAETAAYGGASALLGLARRRQPPGRGRRACRGRRAGLRRC
jgi:hypothetical protein